MNKSTLKLDACPAWTHDLSQSERRFLAAMNEVGFRRFELLRIRSGELVLDPWPKSVRTFKVGSPGPVAHKRVEDAFELRPAVVEFFEYVRALEAGEILWLEIRWRLPFLMQAAYRPDVGAYST